MSVAVIVLAVALAGSLGLAAWMLRVVLSRVDAWQLDYAARASAESHAAQVEFESIAAKRALAEAHDHVRLLSEELSHDQDAPYDRHPAGAGRSTVLRLAESWSRRARSASGDVPAVGVAAVPPGRAAADAVPVGDGSGDMPADRPA